MNQEKKQEVFLIQLLIFPLLKNKKNVDLQNLTF